MSSAPPQLIFGGAGFGLDFKDEASVREVLKTLKENGVSQIDTAALYPPTDMGASERYLGQLGAIADGFRVDTKILVLSVEADGTLEPAAIDKSLKASVERLQLKEGQKINVLHAHAVDKSTPIEEQAKALNEQYKAGHFSELGVCNFPPDVLLKFLEVCDREGYVKPTVYQGRYSLVTREPEPLFDILRKHGIKFNAHSPLAGGFLSGKFTAGEIEGTRFEDGSISAGMLKQAFDKKEFHDAINSLTAALEPHKISKPEACIRWLAFHSKLRAGDGIIFGASKVSYIPQNAEAIRKGPLPEEVVSVMDNLWKTVAPQ